MAGFQHPEVPGLGGAAGLSDLSTSYSALVSLIPAKKVSLESPPQGLFNDMLHAHFLSNFHSKVRVSQFLEISLSHKKIVDFRVKNHRVMFEVD
jgi:hypothetical protein